jgi:ubiquitin carboxyl-terminal hydrolase 35/38
MLLSYQHSPQAFHAALPALVPLIRHVRGELPLPARFLGDLVTLCCTMMYKFPGYPLAYGKLLERCWDH